MAKAAVNRPAKVVAKPGGGGLWLLGLLSGAMVGLATPYALVVAAFLAPAIVLLAIDSGAAKPVGWPIATIGAATLVKPLCGLWMGGHGMAQAMEIAGDARGLAVAWGLQGIGWLVIELAPALIRVGLEGAAQARAAGLRHLRGRIEEEWGVAPRPDVRTPGGGAQSPPG